jgi:hypothetical protein
MRCKIEFKAPTRLADSCRRLLLSPARYVTMIPVFLGILADFYAQLDQDERLNKENFLRWIIGLAFYMRFLKAPSFFYACELILVAIGLNQIWSMLKPYMMAAKVRMVWVAEDGFYRLVSGCVRYVYQVCQIFVVSNLILLSIRSLG